MQLDWHPANHPECKAVQDWPPQKQSTRHSLVGAFTSFDEKSELCQLFACCSFLTKGKKKKKKKKRGKKTPTFLFKSWSSLSLPACEGFETRTTMFLREEEGEEGDCCSLQSGAAHNMLRHRKKITSSPFCSPAWECSFGHDCTSGATQ